MKFCILAFALGFASLPLLTAGETRTLINHAGKKINAKLLSKTKDTVTFRIGYHKKKYTVDISTLSKADQEFLKDWEPEGSKTNAREEKKTEEEYEAGEERPKSLYPRSKREIKAKIKEILRNKSTDKNFTKEQKATNSLNVYRYLCGVPAKVKMDKKLNAHCEEAAKACEKNGALSHELGHYTEKSNLSTISDIVASVPQYIDDAGSNNRERRGHRKWCLNPPMKKTGFGSGRSGYSAMWAMDGAHDQFRVKTWSYPGAGYFPKDYMHGTAWSFYQKNKVPPKDEIQISIFKLRKAPTKKISMNEIPEGRDIGVRYISTYGNAINFEPKNFTAGDRGIYWVRITGGGLRVGYVVEFF